MEIVKLPEPGQSWVDKREKVGGMVRIVAVIRQGNPLIVYVDCHGEGHTQQLYQENSETPPPNFLKTHRKAKFIDKLEDQLYRSSRGDPLRTLIRVKQKMLEMGFEFRNVGCGGFCGSGPVSTYYLGRDGRIYRH